jgi:hypothetical protein
VTELPLNGRNFLQLASLSSGVIPATATSAESSRIGRPQTTVHVAGGRASFTSFLIDGIESRSARFGEISILPPPDVVKEFKIQRNFYSAEYGSSPGVVSVAIRNGTNQFHGSVYEFLRNDNFDAAGYFDAGGVKPEFKLNQFGASFGGPIIKDRTFFFGGYEGRRQRRSNQQFGTVPDVAWLNGDFSGAAVIRDPFNNNQPFPGNIIPPDRRSKVATGFNQYIPAPNVPRTAQGNYSGQPKTVDDFDQFHVRVDHQFSPKDSIFGRYSQSDWDVTTPGLMPYRGTVLPLYGKQAMTQWTRIFGPATVNTFKAGYNRAFMSTGVQKADSLLGADLGLKNLQVDAIDYSLPQMQIVGFGSPGVPVSFGHSTNTFRNWTNMYTMSDTLSLIRGRHTISTGVDLRHYRSPQTTTNGTNGRFVFQGQFTGNAVADYLLGTFQNANATYSRVNGDYRYNQFAGFAQDDWRIRPNLSVSFGLRYEYNSPWREKGGSEGYFDFSIPGLRLQRDPKDYGFNIASPLIQVGGIGDGVFQQNVTNFAPRVGFAWTPTKKTVIRSGFGIFYAQNQSNDTIAMSANPGASVTITTVQAPTAGRLPRLMDTMFDPPTQASIGAGGSQVSTIDPDRNTPYMMQWNFNIQRELPGNLVAEVGYVGNGGRHLVGRIDLNAAPLRAATDTRTVQQRRPYPQWGSVWMFNGWETSNYNAMTASLERRFSKGFNLLASYTFGKVLDTYSSSIDDGSSPHFITDNRRNEYGRSAFDIRQRFAFSSVWELPFGKRKAFLNDLPKAANWMVSGWQINGILQLQTGLPFSVNAAGDVNQTGVLATQRPNRIADGRLPADERTPARWFDTNAFQLHAVNTYGNSGRGILEQDGTRLLDLSFFKNNYIKERYNVQFRAELFNAANAVNFARPAASINGANFGVVTAAGNAREIQFAVRLVF